MIITIIEIVHLVIASLVVGYIFLGVINLPKKNEDLISIKRFNWRDYWFSVLATSPGVILHELAHKIIAISFGLKAYFTVWPFGLVLGVVLKLLGLGFVILAPGYVNIHPGATELQYSLIAFAGPFLNLILWIIALLVVKYKKNISRNEAIFWVFTREINKWLFIFNMIPINPLDGYKIYGRFIY